MRQDWKRACLVLLVILGLTNVLLIREGVARSRQNDVCVVYNICSEESGTCEYAFTQCGGSVEETPGALAQQPYDFEEYSCDYRAILAGVIIAACFGL